MIQLHSDNPYLKDLATVVAEKEGDEKPGAIITKKVVEVAKHFAENQTKYFQDKEKLARMEHDVRTIQSKILHIAGSKDLEGLPKSSLWHEHEVKEGLPETLKQALASMTNMLTVKTLLLSTHWSYYHGDLLSKAIEAHKDNATIQKFARSYSETLLKEAYKEDKQPHYLLRDPSSHPSQEGLEFITLSYITQEGTVQHDLLTYEEGKKRWIHNNNRTHSESLQSLINSVVEGATGVPRSEKKVTDSYSAYM